MKKSAFFHLLVLAFAFTTWAAETNVDSGTLIQNAMTPARFKQIVQRPADSTPLISQLAQVPYWTNAIVSNVMTYASGKVFSETMSQSARTVEGKYIVFTVHSKFYSQPMNSIVIYDYKTAALKTYGLFGDGRGGDKLTEGVVMIDVSKRTYSIKSEYGDGFKETTTGSYNDREDIAKSVVHQNGAQFMTREVVTRPASGRNESLSR